MIIQADECVAEALATTDLARKAVDKLRLTERPEFNPARSDNLLSSLLALFGAGAQDRVVETFLTHLTVFPVVKSRVLQIEFTSKDPALAAEGANAMAELLLEEQVEAKTNAAKAAAIPRFNGRVTRKAPRRERTNQSKIRPVESRDPSFTRITRSTTSCSSTSLWVCSRVLAAL